MRKVLDTILLRLRVARLDADLAAGQAPETSPLHESRARRLTAPGARDALADNWEHLLLLSRRPIGGLSGRVPIQRERVRRAAPEIQELIAALRTAGPTPARGVAIATTVLIDGRGPIYNSKAPDDLPATLELAVEQLNPALPLTHELIGPAHD